MDIFNTFKDISAKIQSASKIAVVGTGALGIEFVGEIKGR